MRRFYRTKRDSLWQRLGCCLLLTSVLLALAPAHAGRAAAPPLAVEHADGARVILVWRAPPLTLAPATENGVHVVKPRLAGMTALPAPGQPDLPAASLLLAIPPGATVTTAVLEDNAVWLDLPAAVAVAPLPATAVDPLEPLPPPAVHLAPAAAASSAGLAPAQVVELSPPVQWRSQTVVRVRVNPVQVDSAGRRLAFHRSLRIEVRFSGDGRAATAAVDEGAFEPLLAAHLANYVAARTWRRAPEAARTTFGAPPAGPWLRIATAQAGLHRIPCSALAAAGVDLAALDPATFRLYRDGPGQSEVSLLLAGLGESECGAAGSPVFYAEAVATPYTDQAVYWLTYGGAAGLRMAVQPATDAGAPVTVYGHIARHEQNRLYYSYIPLAEDAHHWYWDILSNATGASRTYTFTVPALASGPAQLTLDVAGYDGAHRTLVELNGQPVADLTWSGRVARRFDVALDPALLMAGVNRLTVGAAGGAGDYQYFDGFTTTTPQPLSAVADGITFSGGAGSQVYEIGGFTTPDLLLFDVGEPARPRLVSGAAVSAAPCPCTLSFGAPGPSTYAVVSRMALASPATVARAQPFTLHAAENQADYLAIAPAAFHAALAPLLAHRRAQGLRTQLVDLQAVYDEFGGGRVDPFALRTFLGHALAHWQPPAPAYVLLVGDGVSDPRGFVSAPPADSLPALLRTVDPRLGETASDNQYVTLHAGDNLPQFAVGRFPARTAAEVAALVAKTLRYEGQPAAAAWRRQIAVVADNAYTAAGAPDPAGDFWALADDLADHAGLVAAGYAVDRLYYNPCPPGEHPRCALPDPPYPAFADAASLTAALQAALAAGRHLLLYVGHGSPNAWAGNPALLTASQAAALANPDRLTVTLELTCYTGFFQAPGQPALAETLLLAPGGAVATWASSGVSVAAGHDALARGFLTAVTQAQPASLGLATVAGKLELWTAGGGAYRENIDTFHLFGDPALRLAGNSLPAPTTGVYLPWIGAGSAPP
jgi:hypothetical protein